MKKANIGNLRTLENMSRDDKLLIVALVITSELVDEGLLLWQKKPDFTITKKTKDLVDAWEEKEEFNKKDIDRGVEIMWACGWRSVPNMKFIDAQPDRITGG